MGPWGRELRIGGFFLPLADWLTKYIAQRWGPGQDEN